MRYFLLFLITLTVEATAQLTVDSTQTPEYLVQNVLLGQGIAISNVTFNGQPGSLTNTQCGQFNSTAANVGISSGVILATGNVQVAVGPNNVADASLPIVGTGIVGDVDVDQSSGTTTYDAAILEFDFTPAGDTLLFEYVFGSEEYLEFVNTGFNDVFGFFLSGPGITGPYTNGAANIALVPGTSIPVSIDNVNDIVNSQFYLDNGTGISPPQNMDPTIIQFDGFTAVFTAKALVQSGQTYHIKLAVADAGDSAYDSGVFLSGGTFRSVGGLATQIPDLVDELEVTILSSQHLVRVTGADDISALNMTIIGMDGRVYGELMHAGNGDFKYASDLPQGGYILSISTEDDQKRVKFVHQSN